MTSITFPVGYYQLHRDISMNFQMNRWFRWVGEEGMLDEMRNVGRRIQNYAHWKQEFLTLAEKASREGHILRSGFYYRSADFFMRADDTDRKDARQKFLGAVRSFYKLDQIECHTIPYADGQTEGFLPAYRFTPAQSKGVIVFFGGFDSYIEELTSAFFYLRDAGYEVIAFEGPGQGAALDEYNLPMTAEWHKPVKAILDYFKLDQVTLVGLSMGGCLVFRAAALESRVKRVIAYDIFADFFGVSLAQVNPLLLGLLNVQLNLRASAVVNAMVDRVRKKSPVVEWGIQQGMHVTGTSSPFEFFRRMKQFQTADVSGLVKQDVLLMAGSEDHYVPIEQLYEQIKLLGNARSITARLFTRRESAQNHCQVGNYGLALRTIVSWLDGM